MSFFIGILFAFVIIVANILVFKEFLCNGDFEAEANGICAKVVDADDLALTIFFSHLHAPRQKASPRGTDNLEERRSVPNTTNVNGVE